MSKPAPLQRLRDISKQRSIRRPLLVPVTNDHAEECDDTPPKRVEWPIRG